MRRGTAKSASVTEHGEDLLALVSRQWPTSAFRLYSKQWVFLYSPRKGLVFKLGDLHWLLIWGI